MKQYIIGSMLLSSILLASCSLDETPRSKFSEEEWLTYILPSEMDCMEAMVARYTPSRSSLLMPV